MPDSAQPQATRSTTRRMHDTSDVDTPTILIVGVLLAVMVILSAGIAGIMDRYLHDDRPVQGITHAVPPHPHLQAAPLADINLLLKEKNAQLNSYGWIDKKHKTVHIPIARAMDLLEEQAQSHQRGNLKNSPGEQ